MEEEKFYSKRVGEYGIKTNLREILNSGWQYRMTNEMALELMKKGKTLWIDDTSYSFENNKIKFICNKFPGPVYLKIEEFLSMTFNRTISS